MAVNLSSSVSGVSTNPADTGNLPSGGTVQNPVNQNLFGGILGGNADTLGNGIGSAVETQLMQLSGSTAPRYTLTPTTGSSAGTAADSSGFDELFNQLPPGAQQKLTEIMAGFKQIGNWLKQKAAVLASQFDSTEDETEDEVDADNPTPTSSANVAKPAAGAAASKAGSAAGGDEKTAASMLLNDPAVWDKKNNPGVPGRESENNLLSEAQIRKIASSDAKSGPYKKETIDAARHVLDNMPKFDQAAGIGGVDKIVAKCDLEAVMNGGKSTASGTAGAGSASATQGNTENSTVDQTNNDSTSSEGKAVKSQAQTTAPKPPSKTSSGISGPAGSGVGGALSEKALASNPQIKAIYGDIQAASAISGLSETKIAAHVQTESRYRAGTATTNSDGTSDIGYMQISNERYKRDVAPKVTKEQDDKILSLTGKHASQLDMAIPAENLIGGALHVANCIAFKGGDVMAGTKYYNDGDVGAGSNGYCTNNAKFVEVLDNGDTMPDTDFADGSNHN